MNANTYEIFIQPGFREQFDKWLKAPLEKMDNRNLSDKEKQALEDTKKALQQRASMRKGNSKVIRETEDGNEVNDQGLREKEMQIVR